ncbi:hypothetical protein LIER_37323 [Lithospermum erythrorhizon]|uniref:Uncharacterized protein n=1 Tax=Lithospermum erythrorhizon TaxID=34254 RepID=A0AAV3PIS4_LITER
MNKILLNFYSSSSRSRSFLQLIFFEASRCLFISGQIKCVPLASQSLTLKISANVQYNQCVIILQPTVKYLFDFGVWGRISVVIKRICYLFYV